MKIKILLLIVFLLSINLSCSKKDIDTGEVDQMLRNTDSLLQVMSKLQFQLIDSVYNLSDKKLIYTGSNEKLNPKDSLRFYLLLEEISTKLRDIYQYSNKEILFSYYQLESIKEDIIKNGKITEMLQEEINVESNIIKLLEQRVDSSIILMNESMNQINLFLGDTLTLTLNLDSINE